MAVFRVEKNRNFTTMSNYHLRDKNLSLKAKGLLSMCLSLTDDWDYSINGLVAISLEGRTAIMNTVQELEKAGYILRKQTRGPDGKMGKAEYTIREAPAQPHAEDAPQSDKPWSENPTTVNPTTDTPTSEEPTADNPPQLITDQLNTDLINNGEKKEPRHRYGAYENVLLSDDDLAKLKAEFPSDYKQRIERLSEYMASRGKTYRNHLATIRSWARRDSPQKALSEDYGRKYHCEEGESL